MRASDAPEAGADDDPRRTPWPHAPEHLLGEAGAYIVTAATYRKEMLFSDGPRLRMLHQALLEIAAKHGMKLEAWAVFPNHYHFVAHASRCRSGALRPFLRKNCTPARRLRNQPSIDQHKRAGASGTIFGTRSLTVEAVISGARLAYVHHNAVRHRVRDRWLRNTRGVPPRGSSGCATPCTNQERSTAMKLDRVNVPDEFLNRRAGLYGVRELARRFGHA